MAEQILNKQEAILAMQQGQKITHRWFDDNEYMTMVDGNIVLEDGVKCSQDEFWRWREDDSWLTGYSIFKK